MRCNGQPIDKIRLLKISEPQSEKGLRLFALDKKKVGILADSKTALESLGLSLIVLAGGRSLRMGVDKTKLPLGGLPLVARSVKNLEPIIKQAIIVTNRPEELPYDFLDESVVVLKDEVAYQGPLGGLATAFDAVTEDWALAVAADMPWISPALVQALYDRREGYDVVIPVGPNGPEPLLALYRVDAVGPKAREVIETGKRRIVAMFDDLDVLEVDAEELRAADPNLISFFNVNTQIDLAEAHKLAAELGISTPEEDEELLKKIAALPLSDRYKNVRVMSVEETGRPMPQEVPVTFYLNDVEVATVQCSGTYLDDMAVGFLVGEGLLSDRSKFIGVDVDQKRGLVYVTSHEEVPIDLVHKTRYVTSGCGKGITFSSLGHARNLERVDTMVRVSSGDLYRWTADMSAKSEEYREKGGSHSCGLVVRGELEFVREDVGRHNAADKLVGYAWLKGIDMSRSIMLCTGRISYEMMVKAAKARIPFVASRSAATNLAAEIAHELGITLCGYIRGGKVVAYTHPHRLITPEELEEEEG